MIPRNVKAELGNARGEKDFEAVHKMERQAKEVCSGRAAPSEHSAFMDTPGVCLMF